MLAIALFTPSGARGKALLLDFGPTVTQAAYATNDPAHFVGAVPPTEISWNTTTADTSSLVYGDGSAVTGWRGPGWPHNSGKTTAPITR